MKVEQIEPKTVFKPVVITLESQEEVDAIYGVFNFTPIADVLGPALGKRPFKFLEKFSTPRYLHYHGLMCGITK